MQEVASFQAPAPSENHPIAAVVAPRVGQDGAGEYLTFRVGGEAYGIDILTVQEIRSYEEPTRIAGAPEFVKGVVNLRGVIAPIIDLRMKFACPAVTYDMFTVVILLNVRGRVVGAVVDSVNDVLSLSSSEIKPAPVLRAQNAASNHVTGIGSTSDRMLVLLDIVGLMTSPSMGIFPVAADSHEE